MLPHPVPSAPSSTPMMSVMSFLWRWINAADIVILQELQLKHQALEAFNETVEVFNDQLRLHDRFKKKAAPQDLPKYVHKHILINK